MRISPAENGPTPGSALSSASASSAGTPRRYSLVRSPSRAALARPRIHSSFCTGSPNPSASRRVTGGGKTACSTSSTTIRAPNFSAIRCFRIAAMCIEDRCTTTAQTAASQGVQKQTGRRPGWAAWRSPSTGSARPTCSKPRAVHVEGEDPGHLGAQARPGGAGGLDVDAAGGGGDRDTRWEASRVLGRKRSGACGRRTEGGSPPAILRRTAAWRRSRRGPGR